MARIDFSKRCLCILWRILRHPRKKTILWYNDRKTRRCLSLNNHTIYLFLGFQLSAFQKSVNMSGPQAPAGPPLPLEGLAGRLASLSKQLGPPIGPSGRQLPPCPPAPSLSTVGQSHPKPVVPNVEYQRSLNSLASFIHSTPSTPRSQHQTSRSHSNPSTPALPPPGSLSNRQPSSSQGCLFVQKT